MLKHDRIGQIMTVSQEDKISDFGVLVVSCNIVQLCFAVFFSLGRRLLPRSHNKVVNACKKNNYRLYFSSLNKILELFMSF